MILTAALLLIALADSEPSCLALSGDVVRASDLARGIPLFAGASAQASVSHSPQPGMRRIFHAVELQRIARQLGVEGTVDTDLCVERTASELTAAAIEAAMRRSLAKRAVKIEVKDYNHALVPAGTLEFPLSGLAAPSTSNAGVRRWRGVVRDGSGHQYATWAEVRLSGICTRVVALETLPARAPVKPEQIHVETYEGAPLEPGEGMKVEDFVGRQPIRHIPAGSVLADHLLARAVDVERGQALVAETIVEGLRLKAEVIAESSGRRGDTIVVRNRESGRKFKARIEDRNRAVVDLTTGGAATFR